MVYSEPSQESEIELFVRIISDFQLLTEIIELFFKKFNVEIYYQKIIIDMLINFCVLFSKIIT